MVLGQACPALGVRAGQRPVLVARRPPRIRTTCTLARLRSQGGLKSQHHTATPLLGSAASHRLAALNRSSAGRSAAFGTQLQHQHIRAKPGCRPHVVAAVYRRGASLVVCAALAGVENATSVEDMLKQPLKADEKLVMGRLANGMQYVIMPNKLPPQRFEAHLEMHAGSVDERENEQGVAHLVEHVTFLGSRRRENLLGTGARANAYTDFHHTVFHVHSPLVNSNTSEPLLPEVLEALEDIAFRPEFLASRIEKERLAVLAEMQMMNTIEYRVDCQLLTYLHHENFLGCRFPIGQVEQVKKWPHERLKEFWGRWYFPANATLFVVGDLGRSAQATAQLIEKTFGKLPVALDVPNQLAGQVLAQNANNGAATLLASGSNGNGAAAVAAAPPKKRTDKRPPVEHIFGCGPLPSGFTPAPIRIFRHPLLHHYQLSVFCKLPVTPMVAMEDLKLLIMKRMILSVFQFRINARYVSSTPCFISIALDISDSGREGCAVSTLTITAEPRDWREAMAVGVQEVRRLQRHGFTRGELERYRTAILRDSEQLAEQSNKIPSLDVLNFLMESIACGHTVMSHDEAHAAMLAVAQTVTLEEMNDVCRSLLSFASDYGHEAELLADADAHPGRYPYLGPTRATSIVACIPAYMDASGSSIAAGAPSGRANVGMGEHLDVDNLELDLEKLGGQEDDALMEVPEGAVKFDPSPDAIAASLADPGLEAPAQEEVELLEHLIDPEAVAAMVSEMQPHWVEVETEGRRLEPLSKPDSNSQVVQRRLSNGVRLNYRHTDNEPRGCLLRAIFNGGRANEALGLAPGGFGAIMVGTRALSESGTVANWRPQQMEVFCVSNLVNCVVEADEENVVMDFHVVLGPQGLLPVMELMHMFLAQPRWEAAALERAKQAYLAQSRSTGKSLERATADRIMAAMLGANRRFRDPLPEELEALVLEDVRARVAALLHTGNLEVNVVGDFDARQLEELSLQYLGTLRPSPGAALPSTHPVPFLDPPLEQRHTSWHLKDSDERACAYVAGPAPARWGPFGFFGPLDHISQPIPEPVVSLPVNAGSAQRNHALKRRREHPLFSSVTLMLVTEIINSRLFTTVRDTLGLTYDVSFEVTMFDRVRAGWWSVHVTSHPDKIGLALDASVDELRNLSFSPPSRRELARARTTLLTRHESDLKDNSYWLGLITHLQNELVPHKTVTCLRDLRAMYDAVTADDISFALKHFAFEDHRIFTCVGTSGKTAPPSPEGPRYPEVDEAMVQGIEEAVRRAQEEGGEEDEGQEQEQEQEQKSAWASLPNLMQGLGLGGGSNATTTSSSSSSPASSSAASGQTPSSSSSSSSGGSSQARQAQQGQQGQAAAANPMGMLAAMMAVAQAMKSVKPQGGQQQGQGEDLSGGQKQL